MGRPRQPLSYFSEQEKRAIQANRVARLKANNYLAELELEQFQPAIHRALSIRYHYEQIEKMKELERKNDEIQIGSAGGNGVKHEYRHRKKRSV